MPELSETTDAEQNESAIPEILVQTLGGFSLSAAQEENSSASQVSDIRISGRGRRIWLLIAYLIIHKDRDVPVTELIDVLWNDDSREDPLKTLQHNVSRARDMLERCGLPHARNLIVAHQGSYRWNPNQITSVDLERFQELVAEAAQTEFPDEAIRLYKESVSLYKGDFLPGLEMEEWVTPISAYGRSLYIKACLELTRLLSGAQNMSEIAAICEKALRLAPDSEELNTQYVKALTAEGCPEKAVVVYENIRKILDERLGVLPSPELELAYEEARQSVKGESVPLHLVKEMLHERTFDGEGMRVDWNSFVSLTQREARNAGRALQKSVVVSAILHASDYALEMRCLEGVLAKHLRAGDVYTRLNSQQLLILLPDAGEENARTIVSRIQTIFAQQFPQSQAEWKYEWYALESPRA